MADVIGYNIYQIQQKAITSAYNVAITSAIKLKFWIIIFYR